MNTCDKCRHYTARKQPVNAAYAFAGECALMGDSNATPQQVVAIDRAAAWDYESYVAGVFVGPKFGCIHFEARTTP
jgi:hypothetical protein